MNVRLVSITPGAEQVMAYCARVSNPDRQGSGDLALLRYCAQHGHWSVFEMAHMTLEIETSRAIGRQMLRHWSFRFQEFSQRYATELQFEFIEARAPHPTNRQLSEDTLPVEIKKEWMERQAAHYAASQELYQWAIDNGIARECARLVLPEATRTRIYMSGTIRSWLHYINTRGPGSGAQPEHESIATAAMRILDVACPTVSGAMWPHEPADA